VGLDAERQRLEFLPGAAGKLGWSVYALRDPRRLHTQGEGEPGLPAGSYASGGGGRLLADKRGRTRQIHAAGLEVIIEIVRQQLPDEDAA
jgi:hypothetical protein